MSSRDNIRAKILGSTTVSTIAVDFFGEQIELRQATVGQMQKMIDAQNAGDATSKGVVAYLIAYAYVPGTDEKLFDDADAEVLGQLPFDDNMKALTDAINKLTNMSVSDAEKN